MTQIRAIKFSAYEEIVAKVLVAQIAATQILMREIII